MPTIFIALQCSQCSTMQVKQQKKSSNKWNCVVCNQKQSVRKVFAQGFMARDVRKFVQTFNMSRQLAEQQQQIGDENLVAISDEIEDNHIDLNNRKKKRIDWSEYIDPEDDRSEEEQEQEQGEMFEKKIERELPRALFEKPKLKKFMNQVDDTYDDDNKPLRPVFTKKNSNKRIIGRNKEARKFQSNFPTEDEEDTPRRPQPTITKVVNNNSRTEITQVDCDNFTDNLLLKFQPSKDKSASRRSGYTTQNDNHHLADRSMQREKPMTVKLASKWINYIKEDEDDERFNTGGDFTEHRGPWDRVECETTILSDQRVEENIHPDFM